MFALLFPGQGSQQPGMGKFLHDNFKIAQETFEEAADSIGVDLKKLCFEGSVADLALTENTQPCLLTTSIATWRTVEKQFGAKGTVAAGHSIGEYGALVATGAMSFKDAVKAVRIRGQAMQSAVPVGQGGMVAVMGLNEVQINELCQYVVEKSGQRPLSPANFNSPGQIVISGSQKAIDWMKDNAKAEILWPTSTPRMKLIPLTVSAPFHCEMMKPAQDKMKTVLSEMTFRDSLLPIVQNLDAKAHQASLELRENLIQQVSGPVRWMQSMETIKQMGIRPCLELGTGKVLQGLLKKIDSEFFNVFNTNSLEELETIGKLCK